MRRVITSEMILYSVMNWMANIATRQMTQSTKYQWKDFSKPLIFILKRSQTIKLKIALKTHAADVVNGAMRLTANVIVIPGIKKNAKLNTTSSANPT